MIWILFKSNPSTTSPSRTRKAMTSASALTKGRSSSSLTSLPNGFEVLAFPCNQFLKQEPGTSHDAIEFACTRYKAEYPIFKKIRVNGPNTEPVYKFLKSSKSGFFGSRIKWNFTKFLVDKDGIVIARYSPTTSPLSIENDIKKALGVVEEGSSIYVFYDLLFIIFSAPVSFSIFFLSM